MRALGPRSLTWELTHNEKKTIFSYDWKTLIEGIMGNVYVIDYEFRPVV